MNGQLQCFVEIGISKPDAGGHNSTIDNRVIGRRIFDSPALVDSSENLLSRVARLCHANDHVQTLTIRRIWMDETSGFANDGVGIFLHESEAYHSGDEDCAIRTFRVAIDVTEIPRQRRCHVRHTGRQRPINIAAELWPDGPPKLVVSGVTGVRSLDSSFQQDQRLFARSPGSGIILEPLLPELLNRETDAIFLECADSHHLIVIVIIHRRVAGQMGHGSYRQSRSRLMFESDSRHLSDHLCGPDRLHPVEIFLP